MIFKMKDTRIRSSFTDQAGKKNPKTLKAYINI